MLSYSDPVEIAHAAARLEAFHPRDILEWTFQNLSNVVVTTAWQPGGIVILDDYEWAGYREQKRREDPWFEQRGYRVFPLPTGQGLVFKRG